MSQDQTDSSSIPTPVRDPSAFSANDRAKEIFIVKQLVSKDFKLKYRRSVLGVLWSVLNPLMMMIVMSIVFTAFLPYGNIPHYPLYLILGNVIWQVFADSTNAGVTSIIGAASLLKKVRVNKSVFPTERVLFSFVNLAFSFIAVILVMLWEGVVPTWAVLLLPVLLFFFMFFCIGMSLLLSALAVFFHDVIHLWGVVLTAWNYLTPIFWPTFMMDNVPHAIRLVMLANPMYNYVTFMRVVFLEGRTPDLITIGLCIFWAALAFIIGWIVFHKLQGKFILYI